MPSLITPLKGPLADEILLRKSSAQLVLSMARGGLLTIDDLWDLADPKKMGDFTREWGVPTPRGLLWAWRNINEGPAKEKVPTAKLWEALTREDPDAPSSILTERDRLMAWMFSDPRVWTTGPLQRFIHISYASPLDWALNEGVTWALDAALRQPHRPSMENSWWEAALVGCVMHDMRDTLETLMAHSPVRLADIRVVLSGNLNQGTGSAEPSLDGQGYPLLHLVSDPRTAQLLIEGGVDVLAVDADGRTADEHWKVRGDIGSVDNRHLDKRMRDDCLVVFERAIKQLPPEGTLRIRQRQDLHVFTTVDSATFDAWVAEQPSDLTLGEQRWLPNQALANTEATAPDLAKRAGWLLRHQTPQALKRVGEDGVMEREALWWAVAAGGLKAPFPYLKRAWKEVTAVDAWLDLLPAGEANLARTWPQKKQQAHRGMAAAAMGMVTKAVAALTATQLTVEPNLDQMTPTGEHRWDERGTGGVTPMERCLRIAAEGIRSDRTTVLTTYRETFFALNDWAKANPTDGHGQPRHLLLETCLVLFGNTTETGNLNVISDRDISDAISKGEFSVPHGNAVSLAILATSHHLMQAGATVSEVALQSLGQAACGKHPVGQALLATLRETRLASTLQEPTPPPSRRPRM